MKNIRNRISSETLGVLIVIGVIVLAIGASIFIQTTREVTIQEGAGGTPVSGLEGLDLPTDLENTAVVSGSSGGSESTGSSNAESTKRPGSLVAVTPSLPAKPTPSTPVSDKVRIALMIIALVGGILLMIVILTLVMVILNLRQRKASEAIIPAHKK